jgi:hypothetical protein
MPTCRISVDTLGAIRPIWDHPFGVIGSFLDDDVQRSVESCNQYISWTEEVANGDKPLEITGNAHEVVIQATSVSMRCIYDETALPITLVASDFVEVLEYWRSIVRDWQQKGRPGDYSATRDFEFRGAKIGEYADGDDE